MIIWLSNNYHRAWYCFQTYARLCPHSWHAISSLSDMGLWILVHRSALSAQSNNRSYITQLTPDTSVCHTPALRRHSPGGSGFWQVASSKIDGLRINVRSKSAHNNVWKVISCDESWNTMHYHLHPIYQTSSSLQVLSLSFSSQFLMFASYQGVHNVSKYMATILIT